LRTHALALEIYNAVIEALLSCVEEVLGGCLEVNEVGSARLLFVHFFDYLLI